MKNDHTPVMVDLGLSRDHVDIIAETPKAYRVVYRSGAAREQHVWLPKSKVEWLETQRGYGETMHIPAWLARKI